MSSSYLQYNHQQYSVHVTTSNQGRRMIVLFVVILVIISLLLQQQPINGFVIVSSTRKTAATTQKQKCQQKQQQQQSHETVTTRIITTSKTMPQHFIECRVRIPTAIYSNIFGQDDNTNGDTKLIDDKHDDNSSTTSIVSSDLKMISVVQSRRRVFESFTASIVTTSIALVINNQVATAEVIDATDTFASNWWSTTATEPSTTTTIKSKTDTVTAIASTVDRPADDEVSIKVSIKELLRRQALANGKGLGLGIELADIEFRTNIRVYVKSIQSNSYGEQLGIQKDWIIIGSSTSKNGKAGTNQSFERTNTAGVVQYIRTAIDTYKNTSNKSAAADDDILILKFRNPFVFRSTLQNLSTSPDKTVSTQVAPAGETTQYKIMNGGKVQPLENYREQIDQKITVQQLISPKMCTNGGAKFEDLVEISYIGRIVETQEIFDGSAILINNNKDGIAGRGNDITIYFVLGKQPFGQFPPGWDVGLYGICIGERRRITIPSVLAYGPIGIPRRNIPPNATLQYDVTLVSLNGLSTIQ